MCFSQRQEFKRSRQLPLAQRPAPNACCSGGQPGVGGADVMKGALHNHAGFHAHQRQRTGTVAPVVRGFKVDGDDGGRG